MLTTHLNKAIMSLRDATTSNRPLCINSLGEHLWLHTKKSFLNLYCFHIAVEMTSFSMRRVRPLHVAAHCRARARTALCYCACVITKQVVGLQRSCSMSYTNWNAYIQNSLLTFVYSYTNMTSYPFTTWCIALWQAGIQKGNHDPRPNSRWGYILSP